MRDKKKKGQKFKDGATKIKKVQEKVIFIGKIANTQTGGPRLLEQCCYEHTK